MVMKKNTILYILLAFLIIANGFFLVNYLGRPGKPDGQKGPGDFIVKELNFDVSQMERFHLLNEDHRLKMKAVFENERHLKDELFNKISEKSMDETIDSITTLIGNNAKLKDVTTFYFFKNIEKICNDQQKKQLDKLINGALRREGRPSSNPPPPRKQH